MGGFTSGAGGGGGGGEPLTGTGATGGGVFRGLWAEEGSKFTKIRMCTTYCIVS